MSLSFITMCKGRLSQLQRTLHAYADWPTIVVDFDCPEHSGQWVRENFGPSVQVVNVKDMPVWSASLCRNIGAAACKTDWMMFIDADVKLNRDKLSDLTAMLEPGYFYLAYGKLGSLAGTTCVSKADFDAIGGCDEVMEGYGGEDSDFYRRLMLLGLKPRRMPEGFIEHLPHPDYLRTVYQPDVDRNFTGGINRIYSDLKVDIMRLSRQTQLPAAYRKTLYESVKGAITSLENAKSGFINIDFGEHGYGALTRKLTMQFEIQRDPQYDELQFPPNDFERMC